jgi:ATP-binding cassette subfamily F protein 2
MVSDASKKKAAQKKAAAVAKRGSKTTAAGLEKAGDASAAQNGGPKDMASELARLGITDRTCTGVLASHPQSRDIHVSIGLLFCIFCLLSLVRFRISMRWRE